MTGSMNTNVNVPSISMNMGPSLGSGMSGPSMGYGSVANQGFKVNDVLDHLNDRFPTPSVGSSSIDTSFNVPSVGSGSVGSSFKGYDFKPADIPSVSVRDTHLNTDNMLDNLNSGIDIPSVGSGSVGRSFDSGFKPNLDDNLLSCFDQVEKNKMAVISASIDSKFKTPDYTKDSINPLDLNKKFSNNDYMPDLSNVGKDNHVPDFLKEKNKGSVNNILDDKLIPDMSEKVKSSSDFNINNYKTKPLMDFNTTLDLVNKEQDAGLMSGSLQTKYFDELKDNMYRPIGERNSDFLDINNPDKFNKPIIKGREHLGTILDDDGFDYKGSMGETIGEANYVKKFPLDEKNLSVHAPEGTITGAKYKYPNINNHEDRIDNFGASMLDLRDGKINKNTGGSW